MQIIIIVAVQLETSDQTLSTTNQYLLMVGRVTVFTVEDLRHCLGLNSNTSEMKPHIASFTLDPIFLLVSKIHVLVMAHTTKVYIMEGLLLYFLSPPCCCCFLSSPSPVVSDRM